MTGDIVAGVFARGGSKGVPRKNLALLHGLPLVVHAIRTARQCPSVSRVIVSTDDVEIAQLAVEHGADVPWLRPAELAADDSPELLSWRHCIGACEAEGRPVSLLVAVPATAPLRRASDVEACIQTALRDDVDLALVVTPAHRNPWFNMVMLDDNGRAKLVNEGLGLFRRQDAPPVYDVTTVAFAARPDYILRARSIYDGRIAATIVPPDRGLDIDSLLDLAIAECLLNQREVE